MRPPHMNQCISLMSFDSPPLFLVSEDILRDFQCFSVVKESPVFLFKVSTVFYVQTSSHTLRQFKRD